MDKEGGGLENWLIFMDVICVSPLKDSFSFAKDVLEFDALIVHGKF